MNESAADDAARIRQYQSLFSRMPDGVRIVIEEKYKTVQLAALAAYPTDFFDHEMHETFVQVTLKPRFRQGLREVAA